MCAEIDKQNVADKACAAVPTYRVIHSLRRKEESSRAPQFEAVLLHRCAKKINRHNPLRGIKRLAGRFILVVEPAASLRRTSQLTPTHSPTRSKTSFVRFVHSTNAYLQARLVRGPFATGFIPCACLLPSASRCCFAPTPPDGALLRYSIRARHLRFAPPLGLLNSDFDYPLKIIPVKSAILKTYKFQNGFKIVILFFNIIFWYSR